MSRPFQLDFSKDNAAMFAEEERRRKANTMLAVLGDHFAGKLDSLRVLTVGCSAGAIENRLAEEVQAVVGLDVDAPAIAFAQKTYQRDNLSFLIGDAMNLGFRSNSVDVVICSQVYEHVPDASKMMAEIKRVLRPGGVCYFAATSRHCVIEQHYGLPLLSVIPISWAHVYLRLTGKGQHYYERHLSYFGLLKLTVAFERIDYTARLVEQPAQFATSYLFAGKRLKTFIAKFMLRALYWFFPGYVWLLRKDASAAP